MRRNTNLSRASAYWRLARKAERAGQYKQTEHYQSVGDRAYREYLRQREALQTP